MRIQSDRYGWAIESRQPKKAGGYRWRSEGYYPSFATAAAQLVEVALRLNAGTFDMSELLVELRGLSASLRESEGAVK